MKLLFVVYIIGIETGRCREVEQEGRNICKGRNHGNNEKEMRPISANPITKRKNRKQAPRNWDQSVIKFVLYATAVVGAAAATGAASALTSAAAAATGAAGAAAASTGC